MNDFRSHLWDIFVYIGIGALILMLVGIQDLLHSTRHLNAVLEAVEKLSAALAVIIVPAILMLAGALVEPLANGFEKIVFWLLRKAGRETTMARSGTALETYIQKHFTDQILGEGARPYPLCKEYVEANGLSTTFMPFLAKFGFYRSAAFCFLVYAIVEAWRFTASLDPAAGTINDTALMSAVVAIALVLIYLNRGRQFLSYQAPAVYAAFLGPVLSRLLEHYPKDG